MAVKGKLSGHITVERYLRKILFALVCEAEMSAVYIQYGTVTSMCSCVFLKFPVILLCILVHENGKKLSLEKYFTEKIKSTQRCIGSLYSGNLVKSLSPSRARQL